MIREKISVRNYWQQRLADRHFSYVESSMDSPYWTEDACYKFSAMEIDQIEDAADELHQMVMATVAHAIDHDLFIRFGITDQGVKDYITTTFKRGDPTIYGRFDFAYDDTSLKLLEYNADTPTSLFETAVLQWDWLKDRGLQDQFNFVHEQLVDTWRRVNSDFTLPNPLYFTTHAESEEDLITTEYMRETATQAGIKTSVIPMSDIGWNGQYFTDRDEKRIGGMFKLYPWEWMVNEEFGKYALGDHTGFIEPAWKMLVANKQLMVVMSELYPNHPNLLKTYDSPEAFGDTPYVKKAKLGREGSGTSIIHPEFSETTQDFYGKEGYVYQEYYHLPQFNGMHPVLGVWVVDGKACGMGIREDSSRITQNTARYVPHYFVA